MAAWAFVARERELADLAAVLARPGGGALVVAGPDGVGKSWLAREGVEGARAAGHRIVRVLATRSASGIPLGAFLGVLPDLGDGPRSLHRARAALVGGPGDAPLLLLIDDAHLIDDVSATLVLSLATERDVVVLATVRSGAPQPDAIAALWKDTGATRIELGPLDQDAVTELLEAFLEGPVEAATAEALRRASGGVPLALRELVDPALGTGALRPEHGVWRLTRRPDVTPRLGELIERRLAILDAASWRLVVTLALAEPLALPVLAALDLDVAVPTLEVQGLVTVAAGPGGGAARLARPLDGQVALDAVDGRERQKVLAACADALDIHAHDGGDRFRVVLWRLRAGQRLGSRALLDAARRAYLLADYELTHELAEAAWTSEPGAEAGHLLGFTLGRAGRCAEAEAVLATAGDLADDDRDRVLVAVARSENLQRGLGDLDAATKVTREAEGRVSGSAWRDELVAHRAMGILQAGGLDEALRLVGPIVDRDPQEAPRPFVKAAYPATIALIHSGRIDAGMDLARRAQPVHEEVWADDIFQTEPGVHQLTTMLGLVCAGKLGDAELMGRVGLELTRRAKPPYGFAFTSHLVGLNDLHRGRVATAGRHLRDGVGIFIDGEQLDMARWCLAGSALSEALLGRPDAARQALAEADRLAGPTRQMSRTQVEVARGWTAQVDGDPEGARAVFAAAADRALASGDRVGAAHLLHSLARCGGAVDAVDRLAALAEAVDGVLVDLQASFARALADDDPEAGAQVGERFAAIGADLYAAEAMSVASRGHARRQERRSAVRADRRSRELLGACEGAQSPLVWHLGAAAPLTDREREVAVLAARGLSSKEVARRLTLSPRTVDNHLQRVFQKLGASGRSELRGLLGGDGSDGS